MRVLVMTKIFPNAAEPLSSPFNRQQFAELGRLCDVEVLATIPWFPGARAFGKWSNAGRLTRVPRRETIAGLEVRHPRYLFVPKVGHAIAGALYAASLAPRILRYRGQVDVLLGSWAYPDGFAAVALAELLGVPAVVKLHGSDMNVIAKLPGPRRGLRWALPRAARVVAVSEGLAAEARSLGVPADRIDVVRNGVDTTLFAIRDRGEARRALDLPSEGQLILYVGRVEREKGVLELMDAFAKLSPRLPEMRLAIIGGGSALEECRRRAGPFGGRVLLPGPRPFEEIPNWMAASDLLTLPSWNEGMPNVLLEALACGRPVVASRVGGVPEIVTSKVLGEMVAARDPEGLAGALERVAGIQHAPARIVAEAARLGWAESAGRLRDSLRRAIDAKEAKAA